MPVDQPGRTQAGRKSRRRAKARPPSNIKPSPGTGQGPPRKAGRYVMPGKGMGDTGGGQKSDATTRKVERYKATPEYRKTVRDVYDTKSVTRRRARGTTKLRLDYGTGGPVRLEGTTPTGRRIIEIRTRRPAAEKIKLTRGTTLENALLSGLHRQRVARNRELERARAQHDIPTAADWRDVVAHKGTGEYGRLLRQATTWRQYKGDEKQQAKESQRMLASGIALALEAKKEAAAQDPRRQAFDRKVQGTALHVLNEISRPLHATAGATRAAIRGENVLTAASRGIQNKDKFIGADVLEAAGVRNKWVQMAGGFGLDLALDPLSYVGGAIVKPAKAAAEKAMAAELRAGMDDIARRGLSGQEARNAAAQAEARAVRRGQEVYDANRLKRGAPTLTLRGRVAPAVAQQIRRPGSRPSLRLREHTLKTPAIVGSATHSAVRDAPRFLSRGRIRRNADEPGRADRVLSAIDFRHRPEGVHPLMWEKLQEIAQTYRGSRATGERFAVQRGRDIYEAVRRLDLPPSRQEAIARAIDRGDLEGLEPEEAMIATQINDDLYHAAGAPEVERGIRSTLIQDKTRPEVPQRRVRDAEAVKRARDADRAARAAEANVARLEGQVERMRGRAEILSRNVGGVRAERKTERMRGPADEPLFEAGGHGIRTAYRSLRIARGKAQRLRYEADRAAEKAQRAKVLGSEERRAIRAAEKDAAAFDASAKGYFPRLRRQDVDEGHRPPRSSTGRIVDDPSLRQRKLPSLDELGPDAHQFVIDDLALPVTARLAASARMVALRDAQNRIGALLAKRIHSADELGDPGLGGVEGYRVYERTRKGYAPLLAPEESMDVAKVQRAIDAGKEVFVMPERDLDLVYALMGRGRGGRELGDNIMARGFDQVQGVVKTAQTVINPNYHVTNLIGDLYNAAIASTTPLDVARAAKMLKVAVQQDRQNRKRITRALRGLAKDARGKTEFYKGVGRELDDAEVIDLAQRHGAIQMGFGGHELVALAQGETMASWRGAREKLREGSAREAGREVDQMTMRGIRAVNERREDFVRLATFHGALKRGMSPERAARHVNDHHFDYGNLTEFERTVARRLIPFYMFASRNVRLQTKAMFYRPGIAAHFQAGREESQRGSELPEGWDYALRDYQQLGTPIAAPFKVEGIPAAVYPKLPVTDLNLLPDPTSTRRLGEYPQDMAEQLASRLSSLIKLMPEQGLGINLFFREKYKAKVAAPAWAGSIARRNPEFAKLVGYTPNYFDRKTGEYVDGWSWRVDQLARQIPSTNLAAQYATPLGEKPGGKVLPLVNFAVGPKTNAVDMREVRIGQLYERYNELDERLESQDMKGGRKSVVREVKAKRKEMAEILKLINEIDRKKGAKYPRGTDPKKPRKRAGTYGMGRTARIYGVSGRGSGVYGMP